MKTKTQVVKIKCNECYYYLETGANDKICLIEPKAIPRHGYWPACRYLWLKKPGTDD